MRLVRPLPEVDDELLVRLRKRVPAVARDATRRIEREVPAYARAHDPRYAKVLAWTTEHAIGHFVDLLKDPELPSDWILDHFQGVGAGEAHEGRSMEPLQAALRTGAGEAVRRLAEEAESMGGCVPPTVIAGVTHAAFSYIGHLAKAAAQGHADQHAQAAGALRAKQRQLLDTLLDPGHDPRVLRTQAAECGWSPPHTIAAVALDGLRPRATRPSLPPGTLVGFHLAEPCLIVPSPEDADHLSALRNALDGHHAAIGPTVPIGAAASSLRLARQALALSSGGVIVAAEHLPLLILRNDRELTALLIDRRLGPLLRTRPPVRTKLAETFLACIECDFNATEVAKRLDVHPQTIRYRLRQLEELFPDTVYASTYRLEYHLALLAWLTTEAA
ncbi:helix-turn-helix domain-containing protein [Actinomadura fulvescens]|uniref:Helix-turn-helix domain-containing protein n=1 Tax=Actinomadura fulvescens TaxID=46160 RepID=A0ABN3Q5L6_9ACTN